MRRELFPGSKERAQALSLAHQLGQTQSIAGAALPGVTGLVKSRQRWTQVP